MSALVMLARSMVRRRLRAWVVLVVLAGLGGGAVTAAAAGAVRTDTAYPRFLEAATAADLVIPFAAESPAGIGDVSGQRRVLTRIAGLPMVAASAPAIPFQMAGTTDSGTYVTSNQNLQPVAFEDTSFGTQIDRMKILEGRAPDPARADEAVASLTAAQRDGLHVGSTLRLRFFERGQHGAGPPGGGGPAPGSPGGPPGEPPLGGTLGLVAPEVTFHVVGIEVSPLPGDLVYSTAGHSNATIYLTPAFARAHAAHITNLALGVRLEHGLADVAAFKARAESLTHGAVFFFSLHDQEASLQGSIHLEAVALGVFSALAAIALLLVIGQAITRQLAVGAGDSPSLRALGATPSQLFLAGVGAAAAAGVAAAVIAGVVAVLLSPLTPIGLARIAEPHPGLTANVPILLPSGLAIVLLFALAASYPAWRSAHPRRHDKGDAQAHVSPVARAADAGARGGMPVTATTGVRLALLPGPLERSLQTLAAIAGVVIAIAAVVAAITFRASLDQLLTTPRLYGWNWDAIVSPQSIGGNTSPSLPGITAVAEGEAHELSVDADRVTVFGMRRVTGSTAPVVTEGRAPESTGEILLAPKTAEATAIGGTVTVHSGERSRTMTVVGRGVVPVSAENGQLGAGAWMAFETLQQLVGADATPVDTYLVSFAPGVDIGAAVRQFEAQYGEKSVELPVPPQDLVNFGNINQLPAILAAVLVVAAIATLSHSLVTAIRSRRRDLAILKSIGFTRGQVASAVAWQATTLVTLALVIGLPLGVIAGRWAWLLFASAEGTTASPVIPAALLLLVIPAALVLANLVALIPGRLAARTRPALVFRAE